MAVARVGHVDGARWRARPALARVLCLTVFVVPVAVSYAVTRLAAPLVVGLPMVARIVALASLAIVVGFVAERFLRRFLPLAALLRMTMLFPDHAPSRYKLARAAGQTTILEERARVHPDETAGEAATRILGLLTVLSVHDRGTRGHSERVRVFTDVLAAELHLPEAARDRLRWAALLHDLGKVRVPAAVLNKPAALVAAEWDMIRRHPDQGAELAGPLLGWLGEWGAAISQHHERFDGTGYPRGLAGHEIAQAGRIVAVADTFEVMTAARSYKRPMSVAAARRELADVAGSQLDPACVRAFLGASLPRVLWAVGPLALLVNLPFLRGIAEAGRIAEHAGVAAAGQAATVAVAAVVIAVPAVSPAVVSGAHAPRTPVRTSAAVATPTHPTPSTPTPRGIAPREPHTVDVSFHHRQASGTGVAQARPLRAPPSARPTAVPPAPSTAGRTKSPPSLPGIPATTNATTTATPADPTEVVQVAVAQVPTAQISSEHKANPVATVAFAVSDAVSLGTAASFAVLAGSTITSTGHTTITGNLGLSPGSAVTGLLGGLLSGNLFAANGVAVQAKADLAAAYDDAVGRPVTQTVPVELGGTTRTPGVYDSAAGTFGITGTLTLDAKGDPDAVFIFKAASTLITASASRVKLINGARASNIYWQVGSSATLGTYSVLRGNVLALTSITVTTGTTVDGRMLARNGAVTLDSDVIARAD
jgi:HD-GYP domain-containing protein (c-di-GMP phosphodiesterase class II)